MGLLVMIVLIVGSIYWLDSAVKKKKAQHYAKYNIISKPDDDGLLPDMIEIGDPEWKNLRESRRINESINKQSEILQNIANNNQVNMELVEKVKQLEEEVRKLKQSGA